MGSSKNFKKVLSKTVALLYFADTYATYAHRHTWILRKPKYRLSNEGYAAHTPTPHKVRCRFLMNQSKKE